MAISQIYAKDLVNGKISLQTAEEKGTEVGLPKKLLLLSNAYGSIPDYADMASVLEKLIEQSADPSLMYSTNMTVLGYKNKHVQDLWPNFSQINVHASIDAVGKHAGIVRSGSDWDTVEQNLEWIKKQPNVNIRIATVISAINIWWMPELLDYFSWLSIEQFEPVVANVDSEFGLGSIPDQYRPQLIKTLEQCRFSEHSNIRKAVDALQNYPYNETKWYQFLAQQLIQDSYRNEKWFENIPVKHDIYRKTLKIG